MFKSIIIGVISVVVMGILLSYWEVIENAFDTSVSYQKAETIEVQVHPDWASDEEAVRAAKDVIQRKAWEADKERLEGQIEALQTQYEADLEALETDLDSIDKHLGVY